MGLSDVFLAAAVQMDIAIGRVAQNLQRAVTKLNAAADRGARLVVFPECTTSGYCFNSREAAAYHALSCHDSRLKPFVDACTDRDVIGIIGFLELGDDGELYNSALIVMPNAQPCVYRKTHLPVLGVDRFLARGDDLPVIDAGVARIGTLICYDMRFPEAARVTALRGADIITLPTNWPEGAESAPEYVLRARARENGCYIIAANRIGIENGRRFIGRSQIVSPDGQILAQAGTNEETLIAPICVGRARQKRIVIEPGEWEQDTVGDRRPELYGDLTQ